MSDPHIDAVREAVGPALHGTRLLTLNAGTAKLIFDVCERAEKAPPRDLFDAVCEKLENLIPATDSLVDFAKEKGVFLMRQVDEQLNECRDVLARVAAWRKEVGSEG